VITFMSLFVFVLVFLFKFSSKKSISFFICYHTKPFAWQTLERHEISNQVCTDIFVIQNSKHSISELEILRVITIGRISAKTWRGPNYKVLKHTVLFGTHDIIFNIHMVRKEHRDRYPPKTLIVLWLDSSWVYSKRMVLNMNQIFWVPCTTELLFSFLHVATSAINVV
jgi:hypothetical protein